MNLAVDTMKKRERIVWLDLARVLAILFVTFNHAINRTFDNYHDTLTEYLTLPHSLIVFKTVITVLSKLGVPLFLMITGALILNKRFDSHEDVKSFYKHNLFRLFVASELWFIIIYLYKCLDVDSILRTMGFLPAVKGLIQTVCFINPVTFDSMWYLPVILCIYLVMPVFAVAIRKLEIKSLLLPMAVVTCSGMLIPNINMTRQLMGMNGEIVFSLNWVNVFSFYLVYVLLGYVVYEGMLSKIKEITLWSLALITFLVCYCYQYWAYTKPGNILVDYNFLLLAICATIIFELTRRHPVKKHSETEVITSVSVMAFAIYFVHICIMQGLACVLEFHGYVTRFFVLEFISVAGSILMIRIFSKIRFFKDYLFIIKD